MPVVLHSLAEKACFRSERDLAVRVDVGEAPGSAGGLCVDADAAIDKRRPGRLGPGHHRRAEVQSLRVEAAGSHVADATIADDRAIQRGGLLAEVLAGREHRRRGRNGAAARALHDRRARRLTGALELEPGRRPLAREPARRVGLVALAARADRQARTARGGVTERGRSEESGQQDRTGGVAHGVDRAASGLRVRCGYDRADHRCQARARSRAPALGDKRDVLVACVAVLLDGDGVVRRLRQCLVQDQREVANVGAERLYNPRPVPALDGLLGRGGRDREQYLGCRTVLVDRGEAAFWIGVPRRCLRRLLALGAGADAEVDAGTRALGTTSGRGCAEASGFFLQPDASSGTVTTRTCSVGLRTSAP